MVSEINRDPDLEWLDHIQPVGLVIALSVLKELGLTPLHQSPIDTGAVADLLNADVDSPAIIDHWAFAEQILGWETRHTAGTADGPEIPDQLIVSLASSPAVAHIVKRALQRAGITDAPSRGAHMLRHSAATGMLRAGATMECIAAILRHRSVETTNIYARVDVGMLGEIAQPWPGAT